MTYQEALTLKENINGNVIFDNKIPNYVIITPRLQKDYLELLKYIGRDFSLYNDELCKKFCTNNDFILRATITEEGKIALGEF